jgi:hypothetical protein
MKSQPLSQLDDDQLIAKFARAAERLGNAINLWLPTERETEELFAVRNEIRSRGPKAQRQLVPLLESDNRFVRYYAAQQLLALEPKRSRQVIEENAKQGDAVAGDAGMFLHFIDAGVYKPE